jgi:hypothetical protein
VYSLQVAIRWNIPHGKEDIRLLAAMDADGLPAEDFWVIDDHVFVLDFTDAGLYNGTRPVTDPREVSRYKQARDLAWSRARKWHDN